MTLGTLGGAVRRMPIRGNGPVSDAVALGAILAKVSPMRILGGMTAHAIEHGGIGLPPRVGGGQRTRHGCDFPGPRMNPIGERGRRKRIQRAHAGGTKIPMTDPRKPGVIHHRGHSQTALVLNMATAAHLNVPVKRRGRALQQRELICVTGDAFSGIDADDGGMARRAIVSEKEVALRQRAGPHRILNGKSDPIIARERDSCGDEQYHDEHSPYDAQLHRTHRRPK